MKKEKSPAPSLDVFRPPDEKQIKRVEFTKQIGRIYGKR